MDATDVAQVGGVVVVAIDMWLNLSRFCSSRSEASALLALGTQLFNGDRVAAEPQGLDDESFRLPELSK